MSSEISQVLAQMRVVSARIQTGGIETVNPASNKVNFDDLLKQSINSVNQLQQTSASMKTDFQTGKNDVSLAEVMIASEKSSIAFQAMSQVRNKLVDAYKDVMNMPV
jgi:flagellar hook-basal body complex protein FliE